MLLNNQLVTKDKEESKNTWKQMKTKTQWSKNLLDAAKAVIRGKITVIHVYLRKQEKLQINNLTLCLKELRKRTANKTQSW